MLCSGREMWYAILLQYKLTGKTQEACSVEYSLVYDKVKSAILCVYKLVPKLLNNWTSGWVSMWTAEQGHTSASLI